MDTANLIRGRRTSEDIFLLFFSLAIVSDLRREMRTAKLFQQFTGESVMPTKA